MLSPEELSEEYDAVEELLDGGFTGTWGELGEAAGCLAITAWKLTDSYAARHPGTDVYDRVHGANEAILT